MAIGRQLHTQTLLGDGTVLVAAGLNGSGPSLASAERYDPGTNSWSSAGTLAAARNLHTATLLTNGKVLVAGGWNGAVWLASAELYDPTTNSWSPAGSMTETRRAHTATLLPNGMVLVAGGNGVGDLASAELYDPATNAWTAATSMAAARWDHTATLLPDGRVLVAGGRAGTYHASAELYDFTTNTWSAAASMPGTRSGHTATLLPNGKVLAAGGIGAGVLSSAALYDPAANTWSAADSMAEVRRYHTATLLPYGKVLVAAGVGNALQLASAELYDPATDSWSPTNTMITARSVHAATLLPNGKVFASGGSGGTYLASAELYGPCAPDIDDDCFLDPPTTRHDGPANALIGVDNCPSVQNPTQANSDGNFVDTSPPYVEATDDKTWPMSDALGDACDADDDNDGISDADEATGAACGGILTNALVFDTDGDQARDGAECALGTNPTVAASEPALAVCGAAGDADGDKIATRIEFCYYGSNTASVDSDGDAVGGLDGDGGRDGCEIASINGDQVVSSGDQGKLASGISGSTPYHAGVDINKDGLLNSGDQGTMASFISPPGQCL